MTTQPIDNNGQASMPQQFYMDNDPTREKEINPMDISKVQQQYSDSTGASPNGLRSTSGSEQKRVFPRHDYTPMLSPKFRASVDIPIQSPVDSPRAEVSEKGLPIQLHIRVKKLLLFSLIIIAPILLLDVFLSYKGLVLRKTDFSAEADKQAKEDVETYNTYTGTITAAFLQLIESQTSILISTVFFTITNTHLLGGFEIPSYVVPGFLAIMGSGFSALNVQKESGILKPTINEIDLQFINWKNYMAEDNVVEDNTKTLDFPAGAWNLAETALRTTFLAANPVVVSNCKNYLIEPHDRIVQYYFNTHEWYHDMLRRGIPDSDMTVFTLGLTNTTAPLANGTEVDLIEHSDNYSKFEKKSLMALVYDTFRLSYDVLNWSQIKNDTAADFIRDVDTIGNDKDSFWLWTQGRVNAYLEQLNEENQLNIEISDTELTFRKFNLSDNIKFESVSMKLAMNIEADANNTYTVNTKEGCGEYICLYAPLTDEEHPVSYQAIQPRIHAFQSCPFYPSTGNTDCKAEDNEIIIYTYGTILRADDMELAPGVDENGEKITTAIYTGIKRISTITVGRLSWEVEDLGAKFNAQCNSTLESKCEGLSFELTPSIENDENWLASNTGSEDEEKKKEAEKIKHFAIVGKDSINLGSLQLNSNLTPLMKIIQTDSAEPIFRWNLAQSRDWKVPPEMCSSTVDLLAKRTAANRVFVQYGLQNAYTAGLFFLFQNAIDKAEVAWNEDKKTLEFVASKKYVQLRATIPTIAAYQTGIACIILFLGAACVVMYGQTHSTGLKQDQLTPHGTAKLMLSNDEYPETYVDARIDISKSAMQSSSDSNNVSLGELEIASLTLRRRIHLDCED